MEVGLATQLLIEPVSVGWAPYTNGVFDQHVAAEGEGVDH